MLEELLLNCETIECDCLKSRHRRCIRPCKIYCNLRLRLGLIHLHHYEIELSLNVLFKMRS